MGAFLFVGSWRRRELNVRPSYDGHSLMGKDSVAKRRSDCQGQPNENLFLPRECRKIRYSVAIAPCESVRGSQKSGSISILLIDLYFLCFHAKIGVLQ